MRKSLSFLTLLALISFGCHERAQIDIFQLGNIDAGTPPPFGGGVVSEEGKPPIINVGGGGDEQPEPVPGFVGRKPPPEPPDILPPADGDKTLSKCGVPEGGWKEGTYVLREDIRAEADTDVCLPIDRSGFRITIDCKGYEIIGPKLTEDPAQLLGTGIRLHTSKNKIIQHCRIHHFKTGIISEKTNAITFRQNHLYSNKEGLRVTRHSNLNIFEQNEFCENHANDFVCVESRNLSGRQNSLDKMGSLCRNFPHPGFSLPCPLGEILPAPAVIPPPPDDSLPDPNLGGEGNREAPNVVIVEPEPAQPVEATERGGNDELGEPPQPVEATRIGDIDPGICTNFLARFLGLCVDHIEISLALGPDTFTVSPVFFDILNAPSEEERVDGPIDADQTFALARQLQAGSHSFTFSLEQPLPRESINYFRIRNQTRPQASDHLNIRGITIRPMYGEAELDRMDIPTNEINVDLRGGMMIIFPRNEVLRDKLVQHPMLILNKMRARFQMKPEGSAHYFGTVNISFYGKCVQASDPDCLQRESLHFSSIGETILGHPAQGDWQGRGMGQGGERRGFSRGTLSSNWLCSNNHENRIENWCNYPVLEAFSWNYPKVIGYIESHTDSEQKDAVYIYVPPPGNSDSLELDWYSIDALVPNTNNQYVSICYRSGDISLNHLSQSLKCRPEYIIGVIP